MRVVNDTIEYCVSKGGGAKVFVPVAHRKSRREGRGRYAVSFLDSLKEVLVLRLGEDGEAKIIDAFSRRSVSRRAVSTTYIASAITGNNAISVSVN